MPKYFFHLVSQHSAHRDRDGVELPSDAAAGQTAAEVVGDILRREPDVLREWTTWSIEIEDAHGRRVANVPLTQKKPQR
ncbi:DUF6894 family protein [Acuticoccus sp.]|uniref:DUF6894 family protein n=1 Tax=Acuticoccus sp. TaxID=1904378 RepID=UPI003B51575A